MKCQYAADIEAARQVTLHVRVWIEIIYVIANKIHMLVTLHVRVWIEIFMSLQIGRKISVTLHVRVWIEMQYVDNIDGSKSCHPPREGVD